MKKTITLSAACLILTIMAFTSITYTSCTTDKCKDVNCINGGTCTDGTCSCPSGYTGTLCDTAVVVTPATTVIAYQNKTATPIGITINGSSQTIPVGGKVYYSGPHGSAANGTATTAGPVGLTYTWTTNSTFPAGDTLVLPLSVSSGFFFVNVINKSSQPLKKCYANYGLPGQTMNLITVPNDSAVHPVGYYQYYSNSNVRMESDTHYWLVDTLHLNGTTNQVATVQVK